MYAQLPTLLFALISLALCSCAPHAEFRQGPLIVEQGTTVSGRILIEGTKPMPGGIAAFFNTNTEYPPKFGTLHRIPDRITSVSPEGGFTVALPPGSYYLGVIVRDPTSNETGPPAPGEKSYAALDEGLRKKVFETAGRGPAVDLGTINVFASDPDWKSDAIFTIRGEVIDKDGQPFGNARILVKFRADAKQPSLISDRIGQDGTFELQLLAGRPYFLLARDQPSPGRPEPGRYVGAYTGSGPLFGQQKPEPKPVPLTGNPGDIISGVRILMIEVLESELQKETIQGQMINLMTGDDYPVDVSGAPVIPSD